MFALNIACSCGETAGIQLTGTEIQIFPTAGEQRKLYLLPRRQRDDLHSPFAATERESGCVVQQRALLLQGCHVNLESCWGKTQQPEIMRARLGY